MDTKADNFFLQPEQIKNSFYCKEKLNFTGKSQEIVKSMSQKYRHAKKISKNQANNKNLIKKST